MAFGQKSIIGSSEFIRNLYGNIIFNENPYENALEYLAFGKNFNGDRIGDARIFGVAKTECERAFTMLSHDKNNLW